MSSNLPVEGKQQELTVPAAATAPVFGRRFEAAVAAPADEGGTDPRRLMAAMLRYKWLLITLTVVGGAGGAFLSRFQAPEYTAQATIWVQPGGGARGPIQQGQLLQNTNWIDLLRSFAVLDTVVKERRLFLTPVTPADTLILASFDLKERFQPGTYRLEVDGSGRQFQLVLQSTGGVMQTGAPGDSIGAEIGFRWRPAARQLTPGRVIEFTVSTPREAALGVNGRLAIKFPPRDGNFIRLELAGPVPTTTAATLNSIADQFVRLASELKREQLSQQSAILGQQLEASAAELARAEIALERFRVNTITLPSDVGSPVAPGLAATQAPVMSNFFQMKMDQEQYRRDLQGIEAVLRQPVETGINAVNLEAIPAVRSASGMMQVLSDLTAKQTMLRTLRTRFTDQHQQVVRLTEEIADLQHRAIPELLQGLVTELRTRETQLNERVTSASRDLQEIPVRAIEEARRERDVQIATQLYVNLQGRFSESRLAEASTVPDVRVLDAAVIPDQPTKNLAPLLALAGLAAGLGLGVALALLLDRFDRRFRYPDQVTGELGLSIIGAIPRVKRTGAGLKGDEATQVVEALRSIRLNLQHAYGAAGPLILTVTSPGSGDGKSFLSSNLALAFADAGHKTLLIDGDIRRGTLHRVLNANRKPGLLDFLSGQADRDTIVQQTRIPSVDFIGCGTRKMGGPELLASPAMSQLLIHLRTQYGVIIMDSPPLGAGVDPLVLGALTGSVLLVLRTGVTDRELAAAKLDSLDRLPIRILGAVLNDVKADGIYKYYSYLPGYSSEDEAATEAVPRLAFNTSKKA